MKIVFEEGELEKIKKNHEAVKEMYGGMFNTPGKTYGITFTVTDAVLAEYVLLSLQGNKLQDFNIGIDVKTIEFDVLPSKSSVRKQLITAIDNILG